MMLFRSSRFWHFLQLKPQNKRYGPRQAKALVYEGEDGAVEVHYRGERMEYEELVVRPRAVPVATGKSKEKGTLLMR